MPDVTLLLNNVGSGDPGAAAQLLQLVYDDLRRLAARRLAHEAPGHMLEPCPVDPSPAYSPPLRRTLP
jgi:hypothetical protein